MTSKIQPLSLDIVHLIAAGEVIDSLAAVVRELVENALDAGATRLVISLYPEQWRVRVVDNGGGMAAADLQVAAAPHSTSKICAKDDLNWVTSLGFRGEALHSLAQLGQLEICSQIAGQSSGWRAVYNEAGQVTQLDPVAIAPGTVVTVDQLFAQWPTRRQNAPSGAQQLRAVQRLIQNIALCHPQVTWQVEQRDRPWLNLWGSAQPTALLAQFLKDGHPGDLVEYSFTGDATASQPSLLVLGLPDRCHRRRPDWIRVAINGRVVHSPDLEQTILATLRRSLPRDRYPVCFLHLQVGSSQVDWNRHPAKAEVFLRHLDQWQALVQQAIATAVQHHTLDLATQTHRTTQLIKAAEQDGVYATARSVFPDLNPAENPADPDLSAPSSSQFRAIAQLHHTYIICEHPGGIALVEQHIAHERVLYENLKARWELVPLQPPLLLENLSMAQQEQLRRLGLDLAEFGQQVWAIRTVPSALAERADCAEALWELSLGSDLDTALVATACRTAIRNGTPLTLPEMQTILDQWQRTQHPRTCPHGRPICLSLEESSLARYFRRHWVIGKSHGI
jgi:DNA mismatch repair protein MutL